MKILFFSLVISLTSPAFAESISIKVFGLSCGACSNSLEKSLKKLEGVEKVKVDLEDFKVSIQSSKTVADAVLKDVLLQAGYNVEKIERTP